MQKLAAVSAVAVVLAGAAIAAVTATGQDASPVRQVARRVDHPRALSNVAKAAGYLGISTAQLRKDLRAGRTLAQVGRREHPRGPLIVARTYLGVSVEQLRSDRHAGETLAQIANATAGKSEAGLIEALVSARKERLTAAVAAGALTVAEEQKHAAKIAEHVRAFVERVPARARNRRHPG